MKKNIVEPERLTRNEIKRLKILETTIRDGLQTFVSVGQALAEVRESRLYRRDYASFESYCRTKWGMSKTHANRLITGSSLASAIAEDTRALPTHESQLRPLTSSKLTPEVRKEAWSRALKDTSGDPAAVTASAVSEVLTEMEEEGKVETLSFKDVSPRKVDKVRWVDIFAVAREFDKKFGGRKSLQPAEISEWLIKRK